MSESKNVDVVQKFIDSLVELFQDCFREAESEHKQFQFLILIFFQFFNFSIKLEKVFAKKRTNGPRYVMIKNAWDNVLSCCEEISEDIKANASKISLIQQTILSPNSVTG